MKSIALLSILILATLQIKISTTYGKTITKSSSIKNESKSSSGKVSEDKTKPIEMRIRRNLKRNDDYEDFLINRLSRENDIMTSNFLDTTVTCNNLNDLESDIIMEESLRSLFDPLCTQLCKLDIFGRMWDIIKCRQQLIPRDNINFERDRRGKIDGLLRDELFVPVRGRRNIDFDQSAPQSLPEKKAKLDVLMNDLFVPHRGKRQLVRKHFLVFDPYPLSKRSSDIELNMKDFFVPHRGKRQRNGKIDDLLSDNFFPQRGKKASASVMPTILPESHRTIVEYDTMDPWLFQNINTNDRRMIDRLHDLNLGSEANKDITMATSGASVAAIQGEKFLPQMYINNNNNYGNDIGEKLLLDLTPKKILNLNPLSGHQQHDESDEQTSPTNLILNKTPLNNQQHAVNEEFTPTFI